MKQKGLWICVLILIGVIALAPIPAIGRPVSLEGKVSQPILQGISEKECIVLATAKARHDLLGMVGARWAENLSSKGEELADEKMGAIYGLARGLLQIQIMREEKVSLANGSAIHLIAKVEYEKDVIWEGVKRLNAMPIHLERWQRSREREEELLSRGDQIEKGALGKDEQKQMKKIIQCLKALVWNEKALRIWPEDLNPEELDKALAFINKAIELDPAYYMLYLNRGDMYAEQLDPELALLDYAEAIQLNPTCGRAYSMQAIIHAAHYDRKTLACMEAKKACELGECQAIEFLISMGECITAVK